ncbi:MAG: N-acetylmuramoyl-L-alanine amidase D [Sodalis sp. Psp]|nr:N-acetylmuramoyl-L-alanine amidase D [Sodalis sp. Psp]MCR3757118.1 N-acetylmuramoyl-L-alanine amidase D [Sodalis sp. Ppy]
MRNIIKMIILYTLWLTGCAEQQFSTKQKQNLVERGDYVVDVSHPSQAQHERIRFLIFHYTAVDNKESLRLLTQDKVSAHYLIPSYPAQRIRNKLVVLQLVPENKCAWHAGVSSWAGRNNINDTSIGIEIVNDGFHKNMLGKRWIPYHKEQKVLAIRLARDIISQYQIKPQNVLGHSDIAPLRKTDPGPLFPWRELAQQGIGAWPDTSTVEKYSHGVHRWSSGNVAVIQKALATYGYALPQTGVADEETRRVISAFQMHFRPTNFTGVADKETEAIAQALVEKYCNKS